MSDPQSVNWFQTGIGAMAAFFGGFALLIAKRTGDALDSKADKDTVRDKFDEIQQDIRDMLAQQERRFDNMQDRQDQRHAANTARLDHILNELRDR